MTAAPAAVVTLTALFYLPAELLVEKMMPGTMSALGICGMLMVANSIILSRANDYGTVSKARESSFKTENKK